MKIVISRNTSWSLFNFHSGLIKALSEYGFEVLVLCPEDEYTSSLSLLGCRFIPLQMDNAKMNPLKDFLLFWRYLMIFGKERPDIYLAYTIKPNIYGSVAAHLLNVPVINNVTGLGSTFIQGGWLGRFVGMLYRLSFYKSRKVFFQNEDDRGFFLDSGLVSGEVAERLPGSGIDLDKFSAAPMPDNLKMHFLFIGRMLRDKGVYEFIEAARLLKKRGIKAEYWLLGFLKVDNPTAISKQEIREWLEEGIIRYLGSSDDVRDHIESVDCVVLPSYREGVPRTLLEAAGMMRPIIASDVAGCRDVVDDGVNGFLCRPRDAEDLADKMQKMEALSASEREVMGVKGREKVEREFDQKIVIEKYFKAIFDIFKYGIVSKKG